MSSKSVFGTTPDGSCDGSEGYTCGVLYGNCCGKDNKCGGSPLEFGVGWYVVLAIVPIEQADGWLSVNLILGYATPLAQISLQMELVVARRDTSARGPGLAIAAQARDIVVPTTAQPAVNRPSEFAFRQPPLNLSGIRRLEVRMPPP